MRLIPLCLILLAASATPAVAADPLSPVGRWVTDDGKAVIAIAPCGARLCGTIQRFLVPEPAGGARDGKNPDKALRGRKLFGVPILWDVALADGNWSGRGYSPEEGRNFRATLTPRGNSLSVKGCVSLFCRTVVWKRAR